MTAVVADRGPSSGAGPPLRARSARHLRIALISPSFVPVPPNGYGGTERVVGALAEGLVARGHDVTLFAAAGSRSRARLVIPLSEPPPLGDLASVIDDLAHVTTAYLRADEFDVVHDHTGMGPALGAMIAREHAVVHTQHAAWTDASRRLFALLDEHVHLVAISRSQRDSNPGLRYAGVVHNGIDLSAYPLRSDKEDFLIFVGRISAEKAPEVAIAVAREAGLPLVMLVKRTEPLERAYWNEVVAPVLSGSELVLDQPPHAVKVDLIGRAGALLFPIDWPEPFGLVMTESMACGTPVIARPLGAAPEVVSDGVTGVLCADTSEMVEAVATARDLRAEDCRARVEQLFSAEAMVDGYERIYRRAVGALTPEGPTKLEATITRLV